MSTRLRIGMGDSYGLRSTTIASPDFDPLSVTAATFKVTKPSGAVVEWAGSIFSQTADQVVAVYPFAAAGTDLDEAGTWRVWIQWTAPGQTPGPRTETTTFRVVAADQ